MAGSSLPPATRAVVRRTRARAVARAASRSFGAPGLSVWLCVRPHVESVRPRVSNSSVDRSSRVPPGLARWRALAAPTAEEPRPPSTAASRDGPAVRCAQEARAGLSSAGLPAGTTVPGRCAADPQLFSEPSAAARRSAGVRVLSPGVVRRTASQVPAVSGVRPRRADSVRESLPAATTAYGRNAGDAWLFREPAPERWPAAVPVWLPCAARPFSPVAWRLVPGVQRQPLCSPEAGRAGWTTAPRAMSPPVPPSGRVRAARRAAPDGSQRTMWCEPLPCGADPEAGT